jgi:hypothetical protein
MAAMLEREPVACALSIGIAHDYTHRVASTQ